MKVLFIDKENIEQDLIDEGYQLCQIRQAMQFFIQRFQLYAKMVFSRVLGKGLPKTIELKLVDDVERETHFRAAAFIVDESSKKQLVFEINKITLKLAVEVPYSRISSCVMLHEMFHAADYPTLKEYQDMADELYISMWDYNDDIGDIILDHRCLALLVTLRMLNRNRAEGVAQLGEHLLTFENSDEFDSTDQAFESFCQQFETTIQGAQRLIKEQEKNNDDIETYSSCLTYEGAQIVLLKVLGKKGDVDEDLVQRVMKGLITGQFKLTQEEALSIIRAALSLSLAEYIQCLLQMDNFAGRVPEFLLTWCEKHI